jgi:sec-independent protein translocase protein TatA
MLGNLTGWHALIILAIVILLFGATKLPALARSVGQSMKIFKNEVKSSDDDEKKNAKSEDSANDTSSNQKP